MSLTDLLFMWLLQHWVFIFTFSLVGFCYLDFHLKISAVTSVFAAQLDWIKYSLFAFSFSQWHYTSLFLTLHVPLTSPKQALVCVSRFPCSGQLFMPQVSWIRKNVPMSVIRHHLFQTYIVDHFHLQTELFSHCRQLSSSTLIILFSSSREKMVIDAGQGKTSNSSSLLWKGDISTN